MAGDPTQNSILRISDDKTMELIELYEKETCLWNTSVDSYKNRELRAAAAQRIAAKLNIKHFEARHVMIKFKNIRNSYCQELKKIANSINSMDAEVYKPKVFWFSKIDSFLRPYLQPSRTTGFLRQYEESESKEVWSHSFDVELKEECNEEQEPEEWQGSNQSTAEISDEEDPLMPPDPPPPPRLRAASRKRPRVESHPSSSPPPPPPPLQANPTLSLLHSISSSMEQLVHHRSSSLTDDPFDSFGRYVASLLRNMPPQRALALQPRIVAMLTSAAIGNGDARISQSDEKNIY